MNKTWDIPKACPHCGYMVNYPDSLGIEGHNNFCPNCTKQLVYAVPLGSMDYQWDIPVNYGAMDELTKKQKNGG